MRHYARWVLILAVVFFVAPMARAAVFGGGGYGKNRIYNLRATVGNGSVTYGSYTQTILQRPAGAEGDRSDKISFKEMTESEVNPANPSAGIGPQQVKLQQFVSSNPMLINDHSEFEPSKSFGGVGYNLATRVEANGKTLAVNRLALLSNPFAAIFGNVFAGQCTDESCRKLNFGQKGTGTSENNLGGTNLQYQFPGYYIQSNSVLSWDSCDANTPYCNSVVQDIIDDTLARANCTITRPAPLTNSTSTHLGFKLNDKEGNVSCRVEDLSSFGASNEGIVVIENNQSTMTFTFKPSSGTLNLHDIGTVIVYGDIVIDGDTDYIGPSDSTGFIALGKKDDDGIAHGGTITIKGGVKNLAGSFFAPGSQGKIVFEPGNEPLIAKGVFAAKTFELNKRTKGITDAISDDSDNLGTIAADNNYNVAILYDPRLQSNPPPGFKYGNVSILPGEQSLYERGAP